MRALFGQVEQFSIPVPLQEYIKSLHEAISLFGIVSGDMLHVGAHEDQAAGTALAFAGADLFTFLCEKRCAASLQARPGGIRDSLRREASQAAGAAPTRVPSMTDSLEVQVLYPA